MARHGRFVWNELNTHDVEAAKRFHAETLGWTFEGVPMPPPEVGTYWLARAGDEVVAGLFDLADPMFAGVPDHWLPYAEVDDVDARVAKVAAAGGKVLREPWNVAGFGRIAIVEVIGGAVMGWKTTEPGSA